MERGPTFEIPEPVEKTSLKDLLDLPPAWEKERVARHFCIHQTRMFGLFQVYNKPALQSALNIGIRSSVIKTPPVIHLFFPHMPQYGAWHFIAGYLWVIRFFFRMYFDSNDTLDEGSEGGLAEVIVKGVERDEATIGRGDKVSRKRGAGTMEGVTEATPSGSAKSGSAAAKRTMTIEFRNEAIRTLDEAFDVNSGWLPIRERRVFFNEMEKSVEVWQDKADRAIRTKVEKRMLAFLNATEDFVEDMLYLDYQCMHRRLDLPIDPRHTRLERMGRSTGELRSPRLEYPPPHVLVTENVMQMVNDAQRFNEYMHEFEQRPGYEPIAEEDEEDEEMMGVNGGGAEGEGEETFVLV